MDSRSGWGHGWGVGGPCLDHGVLQLLPPAPLTGRALGLDPSQQAVLACRESALVVVGAPGTGKSALVGELIADRVQSGEVRAGQCLVLAPTRRAAARLRDQATLRVGGTTGEALVRTPHSFAFGLLRRAAAARGEPAPRLITGPEQDVILREMLDGHARGEGRVPDWPASLHLALGTRTFRSELRELLMRAVELGLDPEDLTALGVRHERPEWVAAASVLHEYDQLTALSSAGAMDPAWIVGAAAHVLADLPVVRRQLGRDLSLLVVDDAQELTPASVRLLRMIAVAGVPIVLLGDPDQATQTFRGGDPRLFAEVFPGAPVLALDQSHRLAGAIAGASRTIPRYIGAAGTVAHRTWAEADSGQATSLGVHLFRTPAQEAAWLADHLRRRHLLSDVPWSAMAVIVRGGARAATLERAMRTAGVPVVERSSDVAVQDDPAVRPFLLLLGAILGDEPLRVEAVLELLRSPLGSVDAVSIRRLRRALRRQDGEAGGVATSDALLVACLDDPSLLSGLGPEGSGARRVASALAAGRAAAKASGATVEAILWALWSATGLATPWRDSALKGGPAGRRADRSLDAVLALFEAAARHVERLPGAAPRSFLDHLRAQEVVSDTIAARAPQGEAVEILTPADAAGREWDVVAVAGVQEGVWPDLRLRGQLLGAADLVDVAASRLGDRRAARTAVRHDETRLFHVAISRARAHLLVSAVRSDDEQPSVLLDLIDPVTDSTRGRDFTDPPRPFSLVGVVADLRRQLVADDPQTRGRAVTLLQRLAAAGVRGAGPQSWWVLNAVTDSRPRRVAPDLVRISPSTLDRFARCPLQWYLGNCGGKGPSVGASQIGSLVHEVAHDLGDTSASDYVRAVRERWPRLGLGDGWISKKDLALAEVMVGRLAEHVAKAVSEGWRREGSEISFSTQVGRARLEGRVDRVEASFAGDELRIIDLKTGASKPTADEITRHAQLGAYQVAVDAGALGEGVRSAGAALLHLGKAHSSKTPLQVQGPLAGDADPEWARDRIIADAEAMSSSTFVATPGGGLCGTCAVQSSCPARPEGRRLL